MLELLKKLVSIPSSYPEEHAISEFVASFLEDIGCQVERVCTDTDRNNLVVTIGQAQRYLGFSGHLDTVHPAADYSIDPFEVIVAGNVARGLGVCDMKGGLTAMLYLAEYAVNNNLPVKLFFGVDEENISQGAHDLVSSGLMQDVDFLIVPETGHVENFSDPISVCYGRNGRVVYTIEIKGRTVHACDTREGENAIVLATRFVQSLSQAGFMQKGKPGQISVLPEAIQSETGFYSIPDYCSLRCSVITAPGVNSTQFEGWVEQYATTNDLDISTHKAPRKTPYLESYEIDRNNPFLKLIEQEIIVPRGVQPRITPSVGDENVFANHLGIPVLVLGPIGGEFHSSNEWVNLDSIGEVLACYKRILNLYHAPERCIAEHTADPPGIIRGNLF